jgi:hypothetical protein
MSHLVLLTSLLLVAAVEPEPVPRGLRMTIRLEQGRTRYSADEPIPLEVVVRNTSPDEAYLGMSDSEQSSFEILVNLRQSEAGGLGRMPLTKYGTRRFAPFLAAKNVAIRLKAGEERRYRFPLNRMYDMTLTGTYAVSVNRCVPGRQRYDSEGHLQPTESGPQAERLASDEVSVEITEPADSRPSAGQTGEPRGEVIADHLFTVTDDFIIDVYHNGQKVPDSRRTLLVEQFGATAERIDIEVKKEDWLVFNVVNNRLRWGGCSYFAVTGQGGDGVAFTTESESGRWSCCDEPGKVSRFISDRLYLGEQRAQPIENPWSGGDDLMKQVADGWTGKPLWGQSRNTWIKFVVR